MPYLQYLGLDGGVMFSAAVGQVSDSNQKNGKMIVFAPEQLVHTEVTLLYPISHCHAQCVTERCGYLLSSLEIFQRCLNTTKEDIYAL